MKSMNDDVPYTSYHDREYSDEEKGIVNIHLPENNETIQNDTGVEEVTHTSNSPKKDYIRRFIDYTPTTSSFRTRSQSEPLIDGLSDDILFDSPTDLIIDNIESRPTLVMRQDMVYITHEEFDKIKKDEYSRGCKYSSKMYIIMLLISLPIILFTIVLFCIQIYKCSS